MKRTLAFLLALIMFVGVFPVAANAANPVANNLTVTNAVGGECGATVELSWQKSVETISTGIEIYITKSYDGVNYQIVDSIIGTKVKTATSCTYYTAFEDTGKTVYFGVEYGWSKTSTFGRSTVSVKIKSGAVADPGQEAANLSAAKTQLLEALADPAYTKTTEKYDGMKFVVGTKAVWDCKLYTLTATATEVSGSIVTFSIRLDAKLPDKYVNNNGYFVTAISNYPDGYDSQSGSAGESFTISVNTAKTDPLDTSSAAGGMQFFKIRVEKTVKEEWFPVYSSDPNYAGIVAARDVYPENAGYFSYVTVSDTYALSYYVKPTYKLNTNSYSVSQKSIVLGIYGFDSTVKYRVKGAKSWTSKNFAKNKKITLSGLKANTVYEIQLLCKLPYTDIESGKKMYAMDIVSGKSFTLTTSINSKPQITKATVSKIKYGKKKVPHYWEVGSGRYHPAETFNTATYTLTLKLKKVPKNAKGIYVKIGGATYFLKGNKSTYSVKMTYQNKKSVKGIKVKADVYYVSNNISGKAVGLSPAKALNYKLKNGSYK